jgi:hypothetical protein
LKQLAKLWGHHVGLAVSSAINCAFHRINFHVVQAVARLAMTNTVAAIAEEL